MSDLNQPSTSSRTKQRSRPKRNHQAEDDDDDDDVNNNNKNSRTISAPGDGPQPIVLRLFGMPHRSSSRRTTVGSSGEHTEHKSITNSGDGNSAQGPNRKRFRPGSHVTGSNSVTLQPTNGVANAGTPASTKKLVFTIDWDALDGPPELFDLNGDRQSLVCSGGKRPKANQLSPATYLWNIGSIRKVENSEPNTYTRITSFQLLKGLSRQLDEKDEKNYDPTKGECQICSNDKCLLVIPQCPCRMPCCHSCMFTHLEASNARGQEFLCPFCQQPPVRLYYNIKSDRDYRICAVPKLAPFAKLYPLVRAIGLLSVVYENSNVFGGVSPLCRITFASFISSVKRSAENMDRLKHSPKQWFRAFVYIHDLIPWNYSAAQCTLPLPLCDEQVKHELDRLKDFLGAELCYFYSTLMLPAQFDDEGCTMMNRVLVRMRAIVSKYASVQEYFERGEHFQNALINLLPTELVLNDYFIEFHINVPKKIYTESLHFLNSRAPSLDTYIKRVIYTNTPSDQLIYDPCLSRRESRMLRNALLQASSARLGAKLAANEERQCPSDTHQARFQLLSEVMDYFHVPGDPVMVPQELRRRFDNAYNPHRLSRIHQTFPQHPSISGVNVYSIRDVLFAMRLNLFQTPNLPTNRATTVSRAATDPAPIEENIVSPDRTPESFTQSPPGESTGTAIPRAPGYIIRRPPRLSFRSSAEVAEFFETHPELNSPAGDPNTVHPDFVSIEAEFRGLPVRMGRNSQGEAPVMLGASQQFHTLSDIPYITFNSIAQLSHFIQRHPEATYLFASSNVNQNASTSDLYRSSLASMPSSQNVSEGTELLFFRPQHLVATNSESPFANGNSTAAAGPSRLQVISSHENESTESPTRRNDSAQSGEVVASRFHRTTPPNSVAANDERAIGLASNAFAVPRDIVDTQANVPYLDESLDSQELPYVAESSIDSTDFGSMEDLLNFDDFSDFDTPSPDDSIPPTWPYESILGRQNVATGSESRPFNFSIDSSSPTSSNAVESVAMQSEQASMQNLNLLAEVADSGSMNSSTVREDDPGSSDSETSLSLPGSSSGEASSDLIAVDEEYSRYSDEEEEEDDQMIEQDMEARIDTTGRASPPVEPSRPWLYESVSSLEIPPLDENTVKKLSTACRDRGPGYQYFMRQIYPEESDGDSDSDDEYITMRGNPSQWRRAMRSNLLRNGSSSSSGSTNREPDHIKSSSVSPGLRIASTSGNNSQQQVPSRDVASTSKVNLDTYLD